MNINCKNCNIQICVPNKRYKLCDACKTILQKQRCVQYKLKNREHVMEYNKNYKLENKSSISVYNSNYNIENRDTIQQRQTRQHNQRRKCDEAYKTSTLLRNRLRKFVLNIRIGSIINLIGCKQPDFIKWLEFQFKCDMTWSNHGTLWHIDHVIPCHTFNLIDIDEQKICFNWKNMRPLYAKINMAHKLNYIDILHQDLISTVFYSNNKTSFNNIAFGLHNLPSHVRNNVMALVNR